jgi:hypothetical protein
LDRKREDAMWNIADRMVRAVSDVTVGTMIVLFHVKLADRARGKQLPPGSDRASVRA